MSLSHEGGSRLAIALSVAFQCVLSALFGIHSQTWPHVTLKKKISFPTILRAPGKPRPAIQPQLLVSHHGPSAWQSRWRSPPRSCQPRMGRPVWQIHGISQAGPTKHHWFEGRWKPRVVVPKMFYKGVQFLDLAHQNQKSSQPSLQWLWKTMGDQFPRNWTPLRRWHSNLKATPIWPCSPAESQSKQWPWRFCREKEPTILFLEFSFHCQHQR